MNFPEWFVTSNGEVFSPTSADYHFCSDGYPQADMSGVLVKENKNLGEVISHIIKMNEKELQELCEENVHWFL